MSTRFSYVKSLILFPFLNFIFSGCINEWLRDHSTCAYCRTPVRIDMLRSSSSAIGRRQRTRTRRNNNTMSRSSTNDSIQQTSIESSAFEQQES